MKNKEQMEDWFKINILDHIIKKIKPNYLDSIFYVDKDIDYIYMKYIEKGKYLFVDCNTIWHYFKSNYSSDYEKIKALIKYLAEKHLNLLDVTPSSNQFLRQYIKMGSRLKLIIKIPNHLISYVAPPERIL